MNKIDAVITYVNMDDPEWRSRYLQDVGKFAQDKVVNNESRFRDYGGLRACLRSISLYAPWINKIYLVVQSRSQVPEWINTKEVNIVLHEDFIPKCVLPTYSAFSIELFLHLIPGLSEKFLYFNDDMILLRPVVPEEFFIGDLPVHCLKQNRSFFVVNSEYQDCEKPCSNFGTPIRNAWNLATKYSGKFDEEILMSDHGIYSFTQKINNELYLLAKEEIIDSCAKIRTNKSIICWVYLYYAYLTGRLINVAPRTIEVHFIEGELFHVVKSIFSKYYQCVCINDRNIPNYNLAKNLTQESLFYRFNAASKYESS